MLYSIVCKNHTRVLPIIPSKNVETNLMKKFKADNMNVSRLSKHSPKLNRTFAKPFEYKSDENACLNGDHMKYEIVNETQTELHKKHVIISLINLCLQLTLIGLNSVDSTTI